VLPAKLEKPKTDNLALPKSEPSPAKSEISNKDSLFAVAPAAQEGFDADFPDFDNLQSQQMRQLITIKK
jgi:hypothetical protein